MRSSSSPRDTLDVLCQQQALTLQKTTLATLTNIPHSRPKSRNGLAACGLPVLTLLKTYSTAITQRHGSLPLLLQRLEDLLALCTEKLYAFPFKEVPDCWRECFMFVSVLKFCVLGLKASWADNEGQNLTEDGEERGGKWEWNSGEDVTEMVTVLDMAVIMVGFVDGEGEEEEQIEAGGMRGFVGRAMIVLEGLVEKEEEEGESLTQPAPKRRKLSSTPSTSIWLQTDRFPDTKPGQTIPITHPIPHLNNASFSSFEHHMHHPSNPDLGPEPLIITKSLESWPARSERPWNKPSYLMSRTIGGRRLVPIELGRSYVDEGWGQKIISFREFLDSYILLEPESNEKGTGYLAQHNLFTQIPSLRNDIAVPDYCYTAPPPPHHSSPLASRHSELPQLEEPLLNAWFGPAGTISPLHTDPYHNILAQVVGSKYIRLYAPRESERLYARGVEGGGVDMGNTSAVDVGVLAGFDGSEEEQREARDKFPLFQEADYVECILEEGECLYIPVGWWHYVRSLSVSFSVSFWWN